MPTVVPEPTADSVSPVALLASASRSGSGDGTAVVLKGSFQWLIVEIVVTAVAGATLLFHLQQSHDAVNWDDVYAWNAIGATGIYQVSLPLRQRDAGAEFHSYVDGTTGPGTFIPTVLGRRFRIKYAFSVPGTAAFQALAHLR